MTKLETIYDSCKSFYNKAHYTDIDGVKTLYTYQHPVAFIQNGEATIKCPKECLSNTTVRHIREFLKQNGYFASTKKQIVNDYYKEN